MKRDECSYVDRYADFHLLDYTHDIDLLRTCITSNRQSIESRDMFVAATHDHVWSHGDPSPSSMPLAMGATCELELEPAPTDELD